MTNSNKYIIYDMDGTLIDSFESVKQCLIMTATEFGANGLCDDFFLTHHSVSKELFSDFHKKILPWTAWRNFKKKNDELYIRECISLISVNDKITPALTFAEQHSLKNVVLTNKLQIAADVICTEHFPMNTFSAVIGRPGTRAIKPYKYALTALQKNGLDTKDCVAYIGDSSDDAKMAHIIGVEYIDASNFDICHLESLIR